MEKAVISLFNRLGIKADYQGKQVRIIVMEPDEVVGVGFVQALTPTSVLRVRVSDAPDLSKGDSFTTEHGITYHIMSNPIREQHHLVWRADISCD